MPPVPKYASGFNHQTTLQFYNEIPFMQPIKVALNDINSDKASRKLYSTLSYSEMS